MKQVLLKISKNKILKSSAGLLMITLFVKIFGYVEKLVLANYYGTSYKVDVYTVILTLVLSLFFFFREIVEPGFLNVFLEARSKGDEATAWGLFNKGVRIILVITITISIIAFFIPSCIINIFAPGFDGVKFMLSVKLVKIAISASIFLALSTLTNITLNGLKIFVLPASGELAFKGLIIVSMFFFYKEYGVLGAIIGIVIGSLGRLGVHLIKLYKRISFKKITIDSHYKKKFWLLTWPLLIGVSFSQISGLVDNIFASYLQEGAIAALSYAKKVVELPVVIFPYVLSIVVFPYFTQLKAEKQSEKLAGLLASLLKWITVSFLPIAAFLFIFANSLIEIIFQRGAFNAQSTLLTSQPLMIYSLGLVFFAIETILVIFYYANADTKTPVFVGIGCVMLHVLLTWLFISYMGYIGIALAYVMQKVIKNLILLYHVKHKISYTPKILLVFLFKLFVAIGSFIALVLLLKTYLFDAFGQSLISKLGVMAISSMVGLAAYLFILKWMNVFYTKDIVAA